MAHYEKAQLRRTRYKNNDMGDASLRMWELDTKLEEIGSAKGIRYEMLQKDTEDHVEEKGDRRICMAKSDWAIGGKTGVSVGDH